MTSEPKKPLPPPPVAAAPEEEWVEDEGDRPTCSVPAAVLAEIYARPPSNPPPAMPVGHATNGLESMLITDDMLRKAPKMPTETVKMLPLKPRK